MALLAASTVLAVVGAGITGWVAYGIAGIERSKAQLAAVAEGKQKLAAEQQQVRAEKTLQTALAAFGEVFDTLVGKDPALAVEEDDTTGEQTVVARTMVEPRDLELLGRMLSFYGEFAAENAGNQALQLETARAWRRVGAIHARLGTPADLDAAQKGFQQSLERYAGIVDRDVRREVAAVHVEFGQLKYRRMRPLEAEQSFHKAIELLEALPNAATKAIRAERVRVHLAAAASMAPRSAGEGPRGGPGSGRPPGEGRAEFDRERGRRGAEQVQAAVVLADGLLAEDPGNVEFLALRARTYLTQARLSGRRDRRPDADRPESETDRVQHHRAALDLLRQVVAKAPNRTDYTFDFVEALLESVARRGAGPGGPGQGRERERSPVDVETRLATLREALDHVELLMKAQPDALDVVALAARVGSEHGAALRDAAGLAAGEERAARLRQAESELLSAVVLEARLLAGPAAAEPRFVLQAVGTRRELAALYVSNQRRADAAAQVSAVLDLIERQMQLLPADPSAPARNRLAGMWEQRPFGGFEDLLPRLQDAALQQRWHGLRQQLSRPRPPDEPPPDRRR
jgi:tetratricopeptide (TPR) repeat protein